MIETTQVNTDEIVESLRRLVVRIAATVADAKSEGLLRPTEDNYSRYKVANGAVKETRHGAELVSYELEHYTKETWFHAMQVVTWRTKDSEEYTTASALCGLSSLGVGRADTIVRKFNERISYKFSETDDVSKRQEFVDEQIDIIRKHLKQETFEFTTYVKLVGVVAPMTPVTIKVRETEVHFRRVTADDLVDEQSVFFHREHFPRTPTAILQLSAPAEDDGVTQRQLWQAWTILRLFKVGSLQFISCTHKSKSYFAMGGMTTNHDHYSTAVQAVFEDSEVPRLAEFWERMAEALPEGGYEHKKGQVDHVEIAYQRYTDSLLTWGATVERRISDAVMGLESILLTRDENQELIYRLRTRAAKLLGLLGYDPYSARKVANDAYTVRSAFVHGDKVKDETGKLIIKRYRTFEGLLNAILDQLRIVIFVLTISKLSKEEFIKLVDDSFVDHSVIPKLQELLLPVKQMLSSGRENSGGVSAQPA